MLIDDVPESRARSIRCPFCAAAKGQPCTTATVRRIRLESALKRSHRKRRRAWLNARNDEEKS